MSTDYDGVDPKAEVGSKKPPLAIVPASASLYIAQALATGAQKYGAFNWRSSRVELMTYIHATLRHLAAYVDGEEVAEDSGVSHLAHAMASLAVLIDAQECGCCVDNRPPMGPGAELIKRFTKHV